MLSVVEKISIVWDDIPASSFRKSWRKIIPEESSEDAAANAPDAACDTDNAAFSDAALCANLQAAGHTVEMANIAK